VIASLRALALPVLALCAIAPSTALAQQYAPGETIQEAIAAQITDDGFNAIEDIVADLVPTLLDDALAGAGLGDIDLAGIITLRNLDPRVNVRSVNITPLTGTLRLSVVADINLVFDADGLCSGRGNVTADLVADIDLQLNVITDAQTGKRGFDVVLEPNINISNLDINLPGFLCGAVGGLANLFSDFIVGLIQPTIDTAIADLEPTLEEALAAASLETEIALLESTLAISLEPKRVSVTPDGMEIVLSFASDAPQAACIAPYDPGGSAKTDSAIPAITGLDATTQVAAHVPDDLVNQVLYAAWRSGLLCYTVDANSGLDLPITLDTSLLSLLGGDGYKAVVGEQAKPLVIKTLPREVPQVAFGVRGHDLSAHVEDLGLNFMTEVDYRQARILGMDVTADADVDLTFDPNTGLLAVGLDPAAIDIGLKVVPDVFVAGSEEGIETGLGGLVGTLVGSLVGPLLESAAFPLPTFAGLGLTAFDLGTSAPQRTWLTAAVEIGVPAYGDPNAGCDSTDPAAGCSSGCGGTDTASGSSCGCDGVRLNLAGYSAVLLPLWLLRRRRSSRDV
jgi:hypothetical protein